MRSSDALKTPVERHQDDVVSSSDRARSSPAGGLHAEHGSCAERGATPLGMGLATTAVRT